MIQSITKIFSRDLEKLKTELKAYKDEANIWKIDKAVTNCSGNLALHLVGNLNHFIGATLGNTGYVRQRDLEFSQKNVSVKNICDEIDKTIAVVRKVLEHLTNEDLQNEYRRNPFEDYMTTEYFLLHLQSHLAYHLGQINYHRRLLDS